MTAPPFAAAPATRPLHILLAEDNPVNQILVVRRLEQRGHTVVVADTGREAVRVWRQEPFDVVLMDVQMPEMSGFEATTLIRAHEQGTGRHTPIIALTAHAMKGDRERCLEAGMDAYLGKPIRMEELFQIIDELITPETLQRPAAEPIAAGSLLYANSSSEPALVAADDGVIDQAEMERRIGGDGQLLCELLDIFERDYPPLVGDFSRRRHHRRPAACPTGGPHAEGHGRHLRRQGGLRRPYGLLETGSASRGRCHGARRLGCRGGVPGAVSGGARGPPERTVILSLDANSASRRSDIPV